MKKTEVDVEICSDQILAKHYSNHELVSKLSEIRKSENGLLSEFLIYLSEMDRRRLYAREGYSSLFLYLTSHLGFSEGSAFRRVQACRLIRKFPSILELIKTGMINLSALSILEKVLTSQNYREVLIKASKLRKMEIQRLLQELSPQAMVPVSAKDRVVFLNSSVVKPIAATSTRESEQITQTLVPAPKNITKAHQNEPLPTPAESQTEERAYRQVKIHFTADEQLLEKIERAKILMSHQNRNANLAEIFDAALDVYLDKHCPERKLENRQQKSKKEQNNEPNRTLLQDTTTKATKNTNTPRTRYIPQHIRDIVYKRDQGRCTYISPTTGVRCQETRLLEFDHKTPWALGGRSDDPAQIRLLCRCHNLSVAIAVFGQKKMEQYLLPK